MGGAEHIIRFVVAAVIGLLHWQGVIEETLSYVLFAVAGVFFLTNFVNFCPLYTIVELKTCKVKSLN